MKNAFLGVFFIVFKLVNYVLNAIQLLSTEESEKERTQNGKKKIEQMYLINIDYPRVAFENTHKS